MTIYPIAKFNTPASALNFSYRCDKMSPVVMGDDGLFWVLTMADFNRATKAGYEHVS